MDRHRRLFTFWHLDCHLYVSRISFSTWCRALHGMAMTDLAANRSQYMELLMDPSIWAGLLTLIVLEIVLGIDNLVFIAILAD